MVRAVLAALTLLPPLFAQATPAERLLARLSLEQKAAQLMICGTVSSTEQAGAPELRQLVEEIGIGGVLLSLARTPDVVVQIEDLQSRTAIPLLVAGDVGDGLGFCLEGATDLGSRGLLRATGSSALAWRAGAITSAEARSLGVHGFPGPPLQAMPGPVDPALQVDSLGVNPGPVANLDVAWTDGLQSHGVLMTHALGRGGLRDTATTAAALRELAGGSGPLLRPSDPVAARDAIVAAVRAGSIPEACLDEACLRVLRLKERLGLLSGAGLPTRDWSSHEASARHEALAEEIAARGITLARDPHGLIPSDTGDVVVVTFEVAGGPTGAGATLTAELARATPTFEGHRLEAKPSKLQVGAVRAAIRDAASRGALVVLVPSDGREAQTPACFAEIAAVAPERMVVVMLGDPLATPALPEATAVLLGYARTPPVERAAADILTGRAAVTGRLPVTVPGIGDRGDGLSWMPPVAALPRVDPRSQGFAPDLPTRIRELLEEAVAGRAFPCAVAVVARRGQVVAEVAVGRETYADDAPAISADSLFDLASLTKVCATTPSALLLIDRGQLSLDDHVSTLLPAFVGDGKEAVTVRHLLTHTAGLPPFLRFFAELEGKDAIVAAGAATPLESAPGERYRYSDIGMILLMACIEAVAEEPFDAFVTREVFGPLGMTSARFARSGAPIDAVPTEVCGWRERLVRGEVHDENAFAMGGVSGHAGLFANARDVTRLGQAFLGAGRGLAAPTLARDFVRRQTVDPRSSRALGWGTFQPGSSGGSKLTALSFGHTGFTGTSIWCDPVRDLSIVLLTNRVHPTRDNSRHSPVRRELADLVIDCLD